MEQLLLDVTALKDAAARFSSDDPWARAQRRVVGAERRDVRGGVAPPADEPSPTLRGSQTKTDRQRPFKMAGLLGAITFKDRTFFDNKVMLTPEYQWDGMKGGAAWKSRF